MHRTRSAVLKHVAATSSISLVHRSAAVWVMESCCNPYAMQADAQPGDEEDVAADDKKRILKWKEWRV